MDKRLLVVLLFCMMIPVVSAQYWGYYDSPLGFFENEWIMFFIIFIVFFAIIFYTLNRTFNNNAISAVIGIAGSLIITLALTRWGLLYESEILGSWVLIVVVLIVVAFVFRLLHEYFDIAGPIILAIVLWILILMTDPYEVFPYELLTDSFTRAYELMKSFWGLVILVGVAILISVLGERKNPLEKAVKAAGKAFKRR